MRWLLGLISMVVVLVLAVPLLKKLDERMLTPLSDQQSQRAARKPTASASKPATCSISSSATSTTSASIELYRWVDAEGTIHYEMQPPPDGRAQILTVPIEPDETHSGVQQQRSARSGGASGLLDSSPMSVYTPQGQEELMRRLDQTLDALGERQELMQDLKKDL